MNSFKNIILAIIAPIDFWYFMWAVSTMLISFLIYKFTREIFLRKIYLKDFTLFYKNFLDPEIKILNYQNILKHFKISN